MPFSDPAIAAMFSPQYPVYFDNHSEFCPPWPTRSYKPSRPQETNDSNQSSATSSEELVSSNTSAAIAGAATASTSTVTTSPASVASASIVSSDHNSSGTFSKLKGTQQQAKDFSFWAGLEERMEKPLTLFGFKDKDDSSPIGSSAKNDQQNITASSDSSTIPTQFFIRSEATEQQRALQAQRDTIRQLVEQQEQMKRMEDQQRKLSVQYHQQITSQKKLKPLLQLQPEERRGREMKAQESTASQNQNTSPPVSSSWSATATSTSVPTQPSTSALLHPSTANSNYFGIPPQTANMYIPPRITPGMLPQPDALFTSAKQQQIARLQQQAPHWSRQTVVAPTPPTPMPVPMPVHNITNQPYPKNPPKPAQEPLFDYNTPAHVRDIILKAVAVKKYRGLADRRTPIEFIEQFEIYAEMLKLNGNQKRVLFARWAYHNDKLYMKAVKGTESYEQAKKEFLNEMWARKKIAKQDGAYNDDYNRDYDYDYDYDPGYDYDYDSDYDDDDYHRPLFA